MDYEFAYLGVVRISEVEKKRRRQGGSTEEARKKLRSAGPPQFLAGNPEVEGSASKKPQSKPERSGARVKKGIDLEEISKHLLNTRRHPPSRSQNLSLSHQKWPTIG